MDRTARRWTAADIRRFREGRGLSQEGLAREIGVSLGTVARWERDVRHPTGLSLRRLDELERMGNT